MDVVAFVNRFISICRLKVEEKGCFSVDELSDAKSDLIRRAQSDSFLDDIERLEKNVPVRPTSKLASLNPFVDRDGVLRSNGRLSYVDYVPYSVKYPIILPKSHHFSKLLIQSCHKENNHALA